MPTKGTNGRVNAAEVKLVSSKRKTGARLASDGDVAPNLEPAALSASVIAEAMDAAQQSKITAVRDIIEHSPQHDIHKLAKTLEAILAGASPEDAAILRNSLMHESRILGATQRSGPDEELSDGWRDGAYPYRNLMSRKNYERQKYHLQVELLKLQAWVKKSRAKVVILFEGRDAAGKGGTIKRFMEHLNPRGARVIALEKPSDFEKGQWYFQRYVQHLPYSLPSHDKGKQRSSLLR